uniref:Sulfotransferase domain-containing protein n=1 Tax=Hemiselmis andersenii TaxID=464988 RepID=A0A7S1EFJ6_HEMAN|mmetsp:Transcript_46239/g.112578  ORF Transcript_46239/g.112578 Transcript_46239/m.112578 type:complete len:312 (+) Transcript_46239:209-1144(+)
MSPVVVLPILLALLPSLPPSWAQGGASFHPRSSHHPVHHETTAHANNSCRLRNIAWLHMPKTGTSFGRTLIHCACPASSHKLPVHDSQGREPFSLISQWAHPPWNRRGERPREACEGGFDPRHSLLFHEPLPAEVIQDPSSRVVALFRDPRHRLASSFHYRKLAYGLNQTEWLERQGGMRTAEEYAAFPGIAGCQTRMLAGYPCASERHPVTSAMLELSLSRMQNLTFVGLTAHWGLTIRLFHAMFGGECWEGSWTHLRRGDYDPSLSSALRPEDDPHDWEVWKAAVKVFKRRLKEFGFPDEAVRAVRVWG